MKSIAIPENPFIRLSPHALQHREPIGKPENLRQYHLARFERYIDAFAVTEAEILRHKLGPEAIFRAFVADLADCGPDGDRAPDLVGMAVTYVVPWTYTMRPRLVLKKLFVAERARGTGVGRLLMNAVVARGKAIEADHIAWTVMDGNADAERFYRKLGGKPDEKWNNWMLAIAD